MQPPFEPLGDASEALRQKVEKEALRANDRYLHEFLEEYAFCPFAQAGRKEGSSVRRVHYYDAKDSRELFDLLRDVALDEERVVTQIIFPMIEVEASDWHRFCHSLTAHENNRVDGHRVLAVAPLHPKLSYSSDNANTLLTLFRRTPDPTIQWVRLDGLAQIYAGRSGEKSFVPPEEIAALLAKSTPALDLYARIADTNQAMAKRIGLSKVEELLDSYFKEAQTNYGKILLEEGQ